MPAPRSSPSLTNCPHRPGRPCPRPAPCRDGPDGDPRRPCCRSPPWRCRCAPCPPVQTQQHKPLIEAAHRLGEAEGVTMWTEDEASPSQTRPIPGRGWYRVGEPAHYPHAYLHNGTARVLTLLHPRTGMVPPPGVTQSTHAVLHRGSWRSCVDPATLPPLSVPPPAEIHALEVRWQEGLTRRITLPDALPPLRMLLILDNLTGHYTPAFVTRRPSCSGCSTTASCRSFLFALEPTRVGAVG